MGSSASEAEEQHYPAWRRWNVRTFIGVTLQNKIGHLFWHDVSCTRHVCMKCMSRYIESDCGVQKRGNRGNFSADLAPRLARLFMWLTSSRARGAAFLLPHAQSR